MRGKGKVCGANSFSKNFGKISAHLLPPPRPTFLPPSEIPKKLWDVLIHPLLIGNQKFSLVLTYTRYTKTFPLSKSNFSPTFLKFQVFKMPKSLGIPESNNIKQFWGAKGGWGNVFFWGMPSFPPPWPHHHCTSNFPC